MRIGDFTTSVANLRDAFERLELAWDHTREFWDDQASQSFEDQYLKPLDPRLGILFPRCRPTGIIHQVCADLRKPLEERPFRPSCAKRRVNCNPKRERGGRGSSLAHASGCE